MRGGKVKIGLLGNTGNGLFHLHQALRRVPDVETHLFLPEATALHNDPRSDGSYDLTTDETVHFGQWVNTKVPSQSKILNRLLDLNLDLLIVSDVGPMIAPYCSTKVVFAPAGGDFTLLPFGKSLRVGTDSRGFSIGTGGLSASITKGLDWLGFFAVSTYRKWLGINQRRGLRSCTAVIGSADPPFTEAFIELGLAKSGVTNLMGKSYLAIDTDLFSPSASEGSRLVEHFRQESDFIVFHPSRFLMQDKPHLKKAGQWKANGTLIRGFAQAVPELTSMGLRPILVLLDLPSHVSPDVNCAKGLVLSLGVDKHVRWLRPSVGSVFTRQDLASLYAGSHVTADDFGVGWWGSVVLEAMSSGCPVITKYIPDLEWTRYGDFPAIFASDSDSVADTLVALASEPQARRQLAATGRQWVLREHSYQAVANRIQHILSPLVP